MPRHLLQLIEPWLTLMLGALILVLHLLQTKIFLKILDGELKGQTKITTFKGEDDRPKDMNYKVGDNVFIGISTVGYDDPVEYVSLYDIDNTSGIIIMAVLLIFTILIIGRLKGLFSLLSLLVTILFLFVIFIPLTLKGYPPFNDTFNISYIISPISRVT